MLRRSCSVKRDQNTVRVPEASMMDVLGATTGCKNTPVISLGGMPFTGGGDACLGIAAQPVTIRHISAMKALRIDNPNTSKQDRKRVSHFYSAVKRSAKRSV